MSFVTNGLAVSPPVLSSGINPGVSAINFVASAAAGRYAAPLANAIVSRVDNVAANVLNKIAGNGSPSDTGKSDGVKSTIPAKGTPTSGKTNGNNNNINGNGKNNNSGYRPSRGGGKTGVGGSPNVPGIPQTTLDSGIDSGTINNPLQKTTEYFTPLFIQCGQLFPDIKEQSDSTYAALASRDLFYKYLILVQSEVNFSMARNFTQDSFYLYITKISKALQLYYMIDSILAYTTYSPNNNLGMTRLRMAITPDVANSHIKLREFLQTTPIPPNLLNFVRHMYQNYSFSDVIGSPVIRLSYQDALCTSEYKESLGITSIDYRKVLDELIDCATTSSILKKIRPNWVVTMPPSSYEAMYDPQFSIFWHNSNIAYEDYGSKAIKYTIEAKSRFEPLYYGIFGNRLDGLIYASCSVLTENSVEEMGLWSPFKSFEDRNSINSSILHFSNDGLIRPITDVQFRVGSMAHSAPHTVITKDGNPVWEIISCSYAGAVIPQVHSLENVSQAITRSVGYLLNP